MAAEPCQVRSNVDRLEQALEDRRFDDAKSVDALLSPWDNKRTIKANKPQLPSIATPRRKLSTVKKPPVSRILHRRQNLVHHQMSGLDISGRVKLQRRTAAPIACSARSGTTRPCLPGPMAARWDGSDYLQANESFDVAHPARPSVTYSRKRARPTPTMPNRREATVPMRSCRGLLGVCGTIAGEISRASGAAMNARSASFNSLATVPYVASASALEL